MHVHKKNSTSQGEEVNWAAQVPGEGHRSNPPSCAHPVVMSREKGPTQGKVRSGLRIPLTVLAHPPADLAPGSPTSTPGESTGKTGARWARGPRWPGGHPHASSPPVLLGTPEELCTKWEAAVQVGSSEARRTAATHPTPPALTPGPRTPPSSSSPPPDPSLHPTPKPARLL